MRSLADARVARPTRAAATIPMQREADGARAARQIQETIASGGMCIGDVKFSTIRNLSFR